ncbi:outer membrane protein TolC [Neorhizobium sp. 2083]|uniref:TolC family protein n=1 Tax=Neorhizobium sp. 2083 TaxID=2817762 RepID=UPI0028614CF9|nr:TolC family protein [Neorhizobium sp. 2083]MDR6818772.1 outer membrane protein TolC [Neorhizobium sp. 2083]
MKLPGAGSAIIIGLGIASPALGGSKIPIPIPRPDYDPGTMVVATPDKAASLTESKRTVLRGAPLTLADAVFLGLRNNRSIKSAYIDRIAQKFDLRVAEDRFTPQFSVQGEVARQRIGDVKSTTLGVAPGVTFLTPTGATFDFAWNNSATWNEGGRTASSAAEINVEQPLLRGAGVEVNMAPVQQARLRESINRLRLRATVSETIGSIIFAHRDLLLTQEELKLADDAVVRAEDLLGINQALIISGRMAEMDAVQTEADLETQKLRVLQARQSVETARLALLNLLGLDLSTRIVARETISLKTVDTRVDNLIRVALTERQDYQGQLYVIEQSRLGIVVAKNEQLWDISLFARGRFGGEFASGSPTRNVTEIMGGLRFNFPINDLAKQQQLVQADTGYRGAELQLADIRAGIEMQIRGSVSEVDLLWQQLTVADRSRELAARAIEIEKVKLNAGRSTTFQVRSLEDSLRSAENQLLAARIGYLNALTRLDLQLGTTLDTWQISLKE